jgi:hypothetical protein
LTKIEEQRNEAAKQLEGREPSKRDRESIEGRVMLIG